MNNLYILLSFDNYPNVVKPFSDYSQWYLVYFMPYILWNIFVFLPISIAVVYDFFWVKRSELAMKDNLNEKEALFTCFMTLKSG